MDVPSVIHINQQAFMYNHHFSNMIEMFIAEPFWKCFHPFMRPC